MNKIIIDNIYIYNNDKISYKKSAINKRFMAIIYFRENNKAKYKTIRFGLEGAFTYLDGAPEEKRINYIKRHEVREDFKNPLSGGFYSRWFIWEYRKNEMKKILKNMMNQSKYKIKQIEVDKDIII